MSAPTLTDSVADPAVARPSFAELLAVFARIGCLSFGGPAGQIALMHRVLVEEKRWISEARFLHALNFCMLLPGPEAMQLATYVGWLLHRVRGGLAAGLLFILPGLAVVTGLTLLYVSYLSAPWLTGLFVGLKAAVLVIVLEALHRIAKRALKNPLAWALAATAFVALFVLAVPFPLVVIGAGLIGWLKSRGAAATAVDNGGAGKARPLLTLTVWAGLWAAPFGLLMMASAGGVLLALAGFFSQMAVVTFGGAYAVLSYVAQAAVQTHGWITADQMIDGLALAETTPGPLILVLSFVGFMAAFRTPGAMDPLMAGLLGGLVTTWVTFVPCFLWIFLGAPYLERLRGNPALAGALAAITAAVVGVILNLSVWFALHVLFSAQTKVGGYGISISVPVLSSLSWPVLGLAVISAVLLFRLKTPVPLVLAVAGAGGVVLGMA